MAYNGSGGEDHGKLEQVCLKFPPKVSSPGLAALSLSTTRKDKLFDFAAPTLYLQMVLTFVLTQVFDSLLKHLGLPVLISQILAGIVLGPMVFKDPNDSLITVNENSVQVLGTVGCLGYAFFLFLTGVKLDVSMTYKGGRKAVCIGVLTVLLPLAFSLMTIRTLAPPNQKSFTDMIRGKSFLLAVSYSRTTFPVIHTLLTELKILNSELGRLALSAALVSDMLSILVMNIGQWVKIALVSSARQALVDCGLLVAFVLVVVFGVRPAMKWMVRRTPEGGQIKDVFLYAVILLFLMAPTITSHIGSFILFGPFLLGLAVPDGPPLGSALVEKFDPVVSGLFLPLFASTCGMRMDLSHLTHSTKFAKDHVKAAFVNLIVKFGVSLAVPKIFNVPTRDSLALAFIMITRGIVEIGSYSLFNDSMNISDDLFATMSIMVVLLASIVPLLVKALYDPTRKYVSYQRRSIMHSKFNEELRMISCIHVPGDVTSIINFMNVSCPTRETSIALDVLHLVKLSGRATPLFIAHPKNTQNLSNQSYSDNVVLAFNQFERDNWEAVSVNVFTAVSPPNLMYEDIRNLALNNLTSFILLPFHRRWYIDGSIESEDQAIRSLNCSLLERAPCSVGILVEGRRALKRADCREMPSSDPSSYSIAVIFLGGSDDREALALGKRIAVDERVSLTVIHLKATNSLDGFQDERDRKFDDGMLRDIQESGYIRYFEEHVNDGPETSSFLRSIVEDYQLIIVGRRYNREDPQTLGLDEWSEFKEIGTIGDLLSSADFGGNYSLLIVQQQQLRTA